MENEKKTKPPSSQPTPASRKPYVPPEVRPLGRMSDRTLGIGGSRFDPGHNNNTKQGVG
jgi:hypothetical protein